MTRLIFVCLILASSVCSATQQNPVAWIQIEQGNESILPVRVTSPNFTITSGWVGEQFTDENGDGQNDTAKYTWNVALPSVTISFIDSSYEVLEITATQISGGNIVEQTIGGAGISFGMLNDTIVKIILAPSRQPVSCLVAPDANTRTGSPVLWGQAYHTAQRSLINPKDIGYPVDLFSGDVTEKVVDLHVRGRGLDFVWSRRYHSSGAEDSEIGNDWDYSYNISTTGPGGGGSGEVGEVRMGNGRTALFSFDHLDGNDDIFHADGWGARLIRDFLTGEVTIEFGDGTVWLFVNGGNGDGKIDTITDRYGNEIDFTYDLNDRLITITDTLARDYTVSYDTDGFIDALIEVDGLNRTIEYSHYVPTDTDGNAGDLESVNYPAITATVTANNFPDGRDLVYTYETDADDFTQERGDLLTIADGRGATTYTILTNVYDENSRVVSQTWGNDGATDAVVTFDYPSSPTGLSGSETKKTIVNDGEGNVTEFFFNDDDQLLRSLEYTGRAVANLATTQTANRPANKLRTGDPSTYATTFAWNSHDLLTERINPSGNSIEITYGNASVRQRIANITRIERHNIAESSTLTEDFVHEDNWIDSEAETETEKFAGCRCGEVFIERHTIDDTDNLADFDIAFRFDLATGARTGISYGALTGFPSTFHETFEYNSEGQITKRTHPDNGSTHTREDDYTYTVAAMTGYLESIFLDNGTGGLALETTFGYDAVGNVTLVTPPEGHSGGTPLAAWQTQLTYNSNDELIRRRSREPTGTVSNRNQVDFLYDANGNITDVEVENRDETGGLDTNAEFVTTHTYDSLNRRTQTVAEIDGSTNATTTVGYNRNGLPILVASPESVAGNETTNREHLQYDERDLLYRSVRGLGSALQISAQFDYDVNGNLETQTAGLEEAPANQRVTSFDYDEFDRLMETTDPEGNTEEYDYNGANQLVEVISREGGTTRLAEVDILYDISGRRTDIDQAYFDENGTNVGDGVAATDIVYTDSFHVEQVDFEGNTLDYVYDRVNRVSTITDTKGNIRAFLYDDDGNVTDLTETDISDLAAGNQVFLTNFEYDQLDRVTTRRQRYSTASGGLFNDSLFAYDSRNNLVLGTDTRNHDSTFAYDGLNRRTGSTRELAPAGSTITTSTAYDLNSRAISRTDPNGNVTGYGYDPFDRLSRVTYADGTVVVNVFDRFGDVDTRTDASGNVFTHTYDKLSRLTERTISAAIGFDNPGTQSFLYDGLSRMTDADDGDSTLDFVYDSMNHLVSETLAVDGGTARATAHAYNGNDGTRSQTAFPGSRTLDYTYDSLDRLSTIAESATTLNSYDYVGNRIERRTYDDNGTQLDYTYDGFDSANAAGDFGTHRVARTAHTVTSGGAILDDRSYLWDRDQNKLQRDDLRTGGPELTHDYAYDGRSRMTSHDDGTTVTNFTYDAAGNRSDTGYTLTGADALTNNYTAIPSEDRGYDLLGNLSTFDARAETYTFDVNNRLTSYVTAGTRTEDTITVGGNYAVNSGTWSVTNGVLTETSANTARILRDFATTNQEFSFTYKSPHELGDGDYDPEQYAIALLRAVEDSVTTGQYEQVALVIEPDQLSIREWDNNTLLGELGTVTLDSEQDTWYDVKVEFSGTNDTDIRVLRGRSGHPFEAIFDVTVTLAEDVTQEIGFGVGDFITTASGDYEFRDVIFRDTTTDTSTVEVAYKYDALGRRIERTIDPGGTPVVTEFYYDGPHVIEERDGTGTVQATYIYGRGIDEVIQMQRDTDPAPGDEDHYYHQDDLGNVMAITDDLGAVIERYDYGDFGQPSFFDNLGAPISATAIGNDYLFNGRRCDPETGLYFYRSRYMDPEAGRFISRDTIGLYGDANNLGNGQAYVGNNPWTRVDPFGEQTLGFGPNIALDENGEIVFREPDTTVSLGIVAFVLSVGESVVSDLSLGFIGQGPSEQASLFESQSPGITKATRNFELLSLLNLVKFSKEIVGGGLNQARKQFGRNIDQTEAGILARSPGTPGAKVRGGIAPVLKGRRGVEEAVQQALNRGEKLRGTEVTLDIGGVTIRVDLVTETQTGTIRLIEVKNGPGARLSANQRRAFLNFEDGAEVFARGKRAVEADLRGGVDLRFSHDIELILQRVDVP